MTEHLPECPVERMLRNGKTVGSQTCICDALHAFEERVRREEWMASGIYAMGRDDALDAAREAVKGVNWFNDEGKMLSAIVATAESLATIDALRDSETPPPLPPSVGVPERRWT